MGTIFGPDGSMQQKQDSTYWNTSSNNMNVTQQIDDTFFGQGGDTATGIGDITFQNNDPIIQRQGNTIYVGSKVYTIQGDSLYSSDGRVWTSPYGMTNDEITNIVLNDN